MCMVHVYSFPIYRPKLSINTKISCACLQNVKTYISNSQENHTKNELYCVNYDIKLPLNYIFEILD